MPEKKIRCLVTGATGYIGARLAPRLLDDGHQVRALARNPDKLAHVPWRSRAEVAKGDLGDVDSLIVAFEYVDVVYYLVHSMGGSGDFAAAEAESVRNVVTAARRSGVRRVVYLGGLHPENGPLSPHLESRRAVGEQLIDSGIETVVLQAGVVIGSGSASFEMIRHLTDRLPVMTTPKWVHNRIQPIAVSDALHYLAAAATASVPESRTWDIGGPDVLEYGDMMRTYAQVAGLRRRRLIVLPFLTPTIASLWVGTVTPIPPKLARPLIESLECDAVMRNSDVDDIIDPPPGGPTGYRRAVELALGGAARGQVDADWGSQPAEALPSDPDWAGEIVYTDTRTVTTASAPDDVWRAAERAITDPGWQVVAREPGRVLRLRGTERSPGQAWLELAVTPNIGGGTTYTQRSTFVPSGIPGRVYWFASWPARVAALRELTRRVVRPRTAEAVQAP
ncbi:MULTISPECIES: NAD(P)H-binding protein [Mycobacterium]|uniref:Nucleoside-diphosphate sugar epimerase n=1 Tax=Mycobacterium kiyosense TaxID=2871094 RepID=A0A9P3UX47_9MYCO|nr:MULTISPECIES: NAD(P)H-binding protein [Mycobacterium]BDB44486.1 nucleoside-diphosphate sugar epimerase [Mycobacterium kiyosense]BDE15998.1 nucleoside-diphosphate sugar epimerase [Mycobacterium sp. 20KCMC460]GLB81829.1 nucleoside-diphosphate sugar epimerase [Mycobacterium kiyosense]GLB91323.1 nucleoside-diphosphate sugar epimerase [Mycobacterium kiyosense]GLB97340.1 nucleoside-diphosphate sugar epimerase [Mycobacterium kiyosense]